MTKELFISSSPHETKVALLEDDQVVEVYYQRDTDVGLVGGIYKGRVSRVLPGMQSAFVNIGLERDAFLYVSDFLEDAEEYERVFTEAETRVARYTEEAEKGATSGPPEPTLTASPAETAAGETSAPAPAEVPGPREASGAVSGAAPLEPGAVEPAVAGGTPAPTPLEVSTPPPTTSRTPPPSARPEPPEHRRFDHRGRRRRRRGRGFRESKFAPRSDLREGPSHAENRSAPTFEVLPGESLAKYSQTNPDSSSGAAAALAPPEPAVAEIAASESAFSEARTSKPEVPAVQPPTETLRSTGPAPEGEVPPTPSTAVLPSRGGEVRPRPNEEETVSPVDYSAQTNRPAGASTGEPQAAHEAAATPPSDARLLQPGVALESPVATGEEEQGAGAGPSGISTSLQPESPAADKEESQEGRADFGDTDAVAEEVTPTGEEVSGEPESARTEHVSAEESQAPGESDERAYTLRESSQRPRFAPRRGRRGRGRFGRRGLRPEGGPAPDLPRPGNNQPVQIAELLKEGQEILVQIAKEPLGTKGARITSHIALPGRYLVYMPTITHIGVSRKIASEEERFRLRNIILENRGSLTGGFIVRTAGAGRSEDELKADLNFLSSLWSDIRARAERTKAPALLHSDLTLVERILRDVLSPDFKSVRVDNEIEYQRAVEFVNRCQPSLVGQVKLYTRDTPLFEEWGVQQEIDKALKPKVWLKSGGYIVINQTEALVAIDVNTGKYVGKTNRLEDTIVKTNVDAVQEIVRQIRLRDLGGIIVIDFIDMDDRRNRQRVVQALEEALRADRAPTKILSFNEFGLVALTRKRVKQSLERTLCQPCPYCTGAGWVKSVNTICNEIMAEVRKMARQIEGDTLTLRLNPDVARALKSREGTMLSELESLTKKDVIIKSDPSIHQERFEIF